MRYLVCPRDLTRHTFGTWRFDDTPTTARCTTCGLPGLVERWRLPEVPTCPACTRRVGQPVAHNPRFPHDGDEPDALLT